MFNNRISEMCIFWKRACLWMTAVIHMGEKYQQRCLLENK